MSTRMNRRDFLKIAALGIGSLAFRPYYGNGEDWDRGEVIRVATQSLSVYKEPWDKSQIMFQRYRDELVHVYADIISEYGPGYNPLWYRVWGGYIHSALTVKVQTRFNPVVGTIPVKGLLGEVTVPYSQALRYTKDLGWEPVYRLYYQSIHWVKGIDEGPDGQPWYRIWDELLKVEYHIPAPHVRPVSANEFSPLAVDVPPEQKRIEVSLYKQELTAFEGEKIILKTKISSGAPSRVKDPNVVPTETPTGTFYVQNKFPSKHMGDGHLTGDPDAYELPGVPWSSFFEPKTGVALHGTWWHSNYGVPMSHGCINLTFKEALFLYRWTTPVAKPDEVETIGMGTQVVVY